MTSHSAADATPSSGKAAAAANVAAPITLGLLTAISVAVIGSTAESVGVVHWNVLPLNLMGVLIFENGVFCAVFVGGMLAWAASSGDASILWPAVDPAERPLFVWRRRPTLHQLLVAIGALNTVWGIMGVYAEPGYRTPPLIQGILMNCAVLFVAPLSKLLLGDRKQYCTRVPLLAAACLTASVAVSLTPLITSEGGTAVSGDASTLGWIAMFLASLLPGALEGVLEQAYLIRSHALRPSLTPLGYWLPILRLLMWTSMYQLLFMCGLFFVDFLPWFGTSTDAADFWRQLVDTLRCSALGVPPALDSSGSGAGSDGIAVGCDWRVAASAWGASGGFVVSYIGGAFLNRDSATFGFLTGVLVTCVSSGLFLVPGVNPYPAYTPVWSVLVSLALSIAGLCVWKRWELGASGDIAGQFSLKGDGEEEEEGVGSDGTGGGASSEIDDGGVAGDGDGMKARLLLRASESSSSMLSVGSGGGLTPSREGTSR